MLGCSSKSNESDSSENASAMVKVKVLGTAQDGGLPQVGCQKRHCQAAWHDPAKIRLVSCLAIMDVADQKVFLLDATPDIKKQIQTVQTHADLRQRADDNPVDGIFLTHAHMGHYTGLLQLGFESISTKSLPVYCTHRMATLLRDNKPWSQLVGLNNIELTELVYDDPVKVSNNITVSAIKVPHRDEFSDTVGYIVSGPRKRLLYIPDIDHWNVWERPLEEVLKGVDYAFLDGSFFSPEELPNRDLSKIKHPLITQTIDLLLDFVRTGSCRVYFTHLNHSNLVLDADGEKRRWVESQGFFVADDGLELEL